MRKIYYASERDAATFEPKLKIFVKEENGEKIQLEIKLPETKYTAEQRETIAQVNAAFDEHSMQNMTEEEIEYMLKLLPGGEEPPDPTDEELQYLAGFKVEKKIIYI